MVAGKRVPAAYRKGNRRSHLTGDTVYRTGAILVPSGKKLTVGQQRRRRQRGGAACKHWGSKLTKPQRAEYVRKAGGSRPDLQTDVVDQFARVVKERHGDDPSEQLEGYLAWQSQTGGPLTPARVAKLTQAAEAAATPRPEPEPQPEEAFFTPGKPVPAQALPPKQLALDTPAPPGPPPRPPAGAPPAETPGSLAKARSRKAQRAAEVEAFLDAFAEEESGSSALMLAIEQPGWWAEHYEQAAAAAAEQGKPWANSLGTYLVYILSSGPHARTMADAAARVRSQLAEDKPRTASPDYWSQLNVAGLIKAGVEESVEAGGSPFAADRPAAAEDPDSTPRPGADSYEMTPEAQVHAGAAPARVSLVRDPETTQALQRLSLGLEKMDSSRRDIEAEELPAVAEAMASDPEIASLVQRGLLNPRRLSDPAFAAKLRERTLRRESGLKDSRGEPLYSTSTSRPNTLHRGRIARAAVPVFEREGPPSARSGLKYYRRAKASRVPIFSTA
eukprot:COSAG04_NODE_554_length_12674_cov_89.442068_9_plen_503_part_00